MLEVQATCKVRVFLCDHLDFRLLEQRHDDRQPQHSRPHDGRTDSMVLREKFQLNYDPEAHSVGVKDTGEKIFLWMFCLW